MTRTHTVAVLLVMAALLADLAHGQDPSGKFPSPRDALIPSPPPQPSPARGEGEKPPLQPSPARGEGASLLSPPPGGRGLSSLPPGGGGLGWGGDNLSDQAAHSPPAPPKLLQAPGSSVLPPSAAKPKEQAPAVPNLPGPENLTQFDPLAVELKYHDGHWVLAAGATMLKDFGRNEGEA